MLSFAHLLHYIALSFDQTGMHRGVNHLRATGAKCDIGTELQLYRCAY